MRLLDRSPVAAVACSPRAQPLVALLTMTRLECDRVDEALLAPLSELTASCLFEEECEAAFKRRVLTAATREDLEATYFGPGRRQQSTIGRSMLVCAEEDGRVVGACGVQVLILAPDGRGEGAGPPGAPISLPGSSRRTASHSGHGAGLRCACLALNGNPSDGINDRPVNRKIPQ